MILIHFFTTFDIVHAVSGSSLTDDMAQNVPNLPGPKISLTQNKIYKTLSGFLYCLLIGILTANIYSKSLTKHFYGNAKLIFDMNSIVIRHSFGVRMCVHNYEN